MTYRIKRTSKRRGSVYSVVLMISLLISTIGLTALQLQRSQAQVASTIGDFAKARIYARAAIEIGMLQIRNDPSWRTTLGNGSWITNKSMADGLCSLVAVDPIDNDITLGDNHPVILTGIGIKGSATMQLSTRLEVGPSPRSFAEVAMISGDQTSVEGTMLTSDQTLFSNGIYKAGNGASISAKVEAVSSISGGIYNGTIISSSRPREMPDKASVCDYYLANGTKIQFSDLPRWSQNQMLTNTEFESNVLGWYATGGTCTLQRSSLQKKNGLYSMLVGARSATTAVAAQDIPVGSISNGNTYGLLIPVLPSADCTAQARLTITSTGSGVRTFTTPLVTLRENASGFYVWTDLQGNVKPIWTGSLTKATVSISMSVLGNYYMDSVSLTDVTYPKDTYVLDRQLLSPSVNPFGSRQTNAQGIYVIDCGRKEVVVGRMRIIGTLVFVNPGNGTDIRGPVIWEPAVYNFPAILSDDSINITFDSSALSEADYGLNLNPPGSPYPFVGGTTNMLQTDSYPSRITGLIYSENDLQLTGSPVLSGLVIADDDLTISGTSCAMTYSNIYLNDPPPGFDVGHTEMKEVPGTWKRSVQ